MLEDLAAREVAPGLWRWTAWHEEWKQDVGCLALLRPDATVLIDPLVPESATRAWRGIGDAGEDPSRALAVVLTVFFHRRSADRIAERPGAEILADAGGLDELAGLPVDRPYRAGDALPGGILALPTPRPGESLLWIEDLGALVPGDVILGGETPGTLRLCPDSWLPDGIGRDDLARSLRPVLSRPVERVLVSHGEPVLEDGVARLAEAIG